MRFTNTVSVWPVGLSGGIKFEGPICNRGKVIGWYAMWDRMRKFQIDMAGFAINLKLLLSKPEASLDHKAKRGRLEDSILHHLVTMDELEPKADNCSKVAHHFLPLPQNEDTVHITAGKEFKHVQAKALCRDLEPKTDRVSKFFPVPM